MNPIEKNAVGVSGLRVVLHALRAQGHIIEDFLKPLGLRDVDFDNPDHRITGMAAQQIWANAIQLTKDEDLGLHLAEQIQPDSMGAFSHLIRASATVQEAWQRAGAAFRLIADGIDLRLVNSPPHARLEHRVSLPVTLHRGLAELALGSMLIGVQAGCDEAICPIEVHFQAPQPASISEHKRIFQCPITWNAPCDVLIVSSEVLDRKMVHADPGLAKVLDRYVSELIARLPKHDDFIDQVVRSIELEFRQGHSKAEGVAKRLGISPRTLQRRLREHDTNFQELLDKMRCELAMQHLQSRRFSIGEIAYFLGFSEPSAFHRAFRRWTGKTTSEYRQKQRTKS